VSNAFGNRLRRFRQERKMTMEQLAEAVGVSKSYIWALENNPEQRVQRTSATVMNSLAKALGVNLLDLMGEASPEPLGDERKTGGRRMFFRNYMDMAEEDRETYRQMLELFRRPKDK
jgi:transcriptional regulator with XRE-family HTH domain